MTQFQLERDEVEAWRSKVKMAGSKLKFRWQGLSKRRYILTNRRALVLEGKKAENVVDSRELLKSTVALTHKFEVDRAMLYDPEHKWSTRRLGREFVTIGTLTFMAEGHHPMAFEEIEDPDSVLELAEKLIKDLMLP